ncbi:hypothetical protein [Clostridium scatologenes]|uniref:Uncharacterized protein n=1 Tax=Clostridium scatologenes TaxID=1548 RepID=A0A0E3GQG0_CLOSL|nr:hypothetical protein [Clostridium scatologenes]AKA68506.1 hypothetical protein CSCA_1381 [Clostridium scatologenes]
MKITAEFNSNEELLNFISTFGTKAIVTGQVVDQVAKKTVTNYKPEVKKDTKKETSKVEVAKENKKEDVKKEDKEEVTKSDVKTEESTESKDTKEDKKEDTEITKEMVRAIFTKLIKAGKQKEAKEITEKYGAKRLPDLAEEHYAAAYKEVEALL